jgi:hypothetical protein
MNKYNVSAVWETDAGQIYNGNSFDEALAVFNRHVSSGVDIYIELQVKDPNSTYYNAIQTYSYGDSPS